MRGEGCRLGRGSKRAPDEGCRNEGGQHGERSPGRKHGSLVVPRGGKDGPEGAVAALNKASGHVRTEISRRMHIRKAPRFVFVVDEGAAYAAHINQLLADLQEGAAPAEAAGEEE